MKKQLFISVFLIVIGITGHAQGKPGFGFFTDRDVYVSGESLLAKIFIPEDNPSRIVYFDLVNKYGTRISGASLNIRNKQADGFLQLPDSLSSGTYLLRAYLKNTAEKLKTIREIWISNRFDGMEKTSQMNRVEVAGKITDKETGHIHLEDLKAEYPTNSSIDTKINIDESLLKDIDGNLMVCVAQTEPSFESSAFTWTSDQGKEGMIERKGIILSGTVIDKKTKEPASGVTVYQTIPDSIPGFQYYITKNDGRFYFLVDNYFGSVQAFIQCFGQTPAQRLKIKMDDLFAAPGTQPSFSQTPIPEEFKNNLARNIETITFQKIFAQDKLKLLPPSKKKPEDYTYYGKPTKTVNPHLFIDLPNFTEISRELLPGVKFRNYNNEPTIQVFNNSRRNFFDENPLILIDGIPIRDLNVIKDMGTQDINHIDICQNERFYGDLRFPGVVAIYTSKADYSRLTETDQFIPLKLEAIQLSPNLTEPVNTEAAVPDLRQVIYWNPSVEPNQKLEIRCNTSTIIGKFKLVIRGRLKDGTNIFAEKQFEVK